MNNFEKIKAMTLDEMAELLLNDVCDLDTPCKQCTNNAYCSCSTKEDFIQWLMQDLKN